MFVFLLQQASILALLLVVCWSAGALIVGRDSIALQATTGLAAAAHACFLLALAGQLRPVPLLLVSAVVLIGAPLRLRSAMPGTTTPAPRWSRNGIAWSSSVAAGAMLFLLAVLPPLAFDETLYHLPLVRAYAESGGLPFVSHVRFPVFPVLHELLAVPAFLAGGPPATHLIALAQTLVAAALLFEWGRTRSARAGWLAVALFAGSPLVMHLSTVLYADIALALFVAGGFHALERDRAALAGFLLGTACSVKYLGFWFALVATLMIVTRRKEIFRTVAPFALAGALAVLPMSGWITARTGSPLFPFVASGVWTVDPAPPLTMSERIVSVLRAPWDVTFARERAGLQPPVTPLLIPMLIVVCVAARRSKRARWLVACTVGYLACFTFTLPDSRYLVPLLALLSIAAATAIDAKWPRASLLLALLAIVPGLAYAGYRLTLLGPPPATDDAREAWLERQVPGYRAVQQTGTSRAYSCGGEQWKGYAAGTLFGDHFGPYSFDRILGGASETHAIAARLRPLGVEYYVVAKDACPAPRETGGMQLVYEDAGAQLWRVQ